MAAQQLFDLREQALALVQLGKRDFAVDHVGTGQHGAGMAQRGQFEALDVELEEIDRGVIVQHVVEGAGGDLPGARRAQLAQVHQLPGERGIERQQRRRGVRHVQVERVTAAVADEVRVHAHGGAVGLAPFGQLVRDRFEADDLARQAVAGQCRIHMLFVGQDLRAHVHDAQR